MRQGIVKYNNTFAGLITETDEGLYVFQYEALAYKNWVDHRVSLFL